MYIITTFVHKVKTESIYNTFFSKKFLFSLIGNGKNFVNWGRNIDFVCNSGYTERNKETKKEDVPMKAIWKLLVVLGVLTTAAVAVMMWLRSRKKAEIEFDEDCCVWADDEDEAVEE